jgi:hypothetical protein
MFASSHYIHIVHVFFDFLSFFHMVVLLINHHMVWYGVVWYGITYYFKVSFLHLICTCISRNVLVFFLYFSFLSSLSFHVCVLHYSLHTRFVSFHEGALIFNLYRYICILSFFHFQYACTFHLVSYFFLCVCVVISSFSRMNYGAFSSRSLRFFSLLLLLCSLYMVYLLFLCLFFYSYVMFTPLVTDFFSILFAYVCCFITCT